MSCEDCKFWDRNSFGESDGFCCRYPPTPVVIHDGEDIEDYAFVWAETNRHNWCGEWVKKEKP